MVGTAGFERYCWCHIGLRRTKYNSGAAARNVCSMYRNMMQVISKCTRVLARSIGQRQFMVVQQFSLLTVRGSNSIVIQEAGGKYN